MISNTLTHVNPSISILWQDETALAVNKPSGLLVHNSRYAGPREYSLRQMVGDQLGHPVYPLHRLDRPASGVLLFVKQRQWASPWQERLASTPTEKIYLALVRGRLTTPVTIDHPLKDGDVYREARSHIAPLLSSTFERCSLLQVRIETGRKHQVRRHLAHISHPIIGDTAYGKGAINRHYRAQYDLRRLALHAWRLGISHPLTDECLRLCAPLPADLRSPLISLFPTSDLSQILSCGEVKNIF
jgi:tRNA pseudouridine65 synthase